MDGMTLQKYAEEIQVPMSKAKLSHPDFLKDREKLIRNAVEAYGTDGVTDKQMRISLACRTETRDMKAFVRVRLAEQMAVEDSAGPRAHSVVRPLHQLGAGPRVRSVWRR